eukprot:scaffold130972_cov36-Tisochrysis_lutea.AAC.2
MERMFCARGGQIGGSVAANASATALFPMSIVSLMKIDAFPLCQLIGQDHLGTAAAKAAHCKAT